MATQTHGSLANLLVNGYDLSPFHNSIQADGMIDVVEDTSFGPIGAPTIAKSYIAGQDDSTLQASGKYVIDETGLTHDQVADVIEAAIAAEAVGSVGAAAVTYLPLGDGFGLPARGMLADVIEYDVTSPVNAIVAVQTKLQSSSGFGGMSVLLPAVSEAATTTGTDLDAGASYDPTKIKGIVAAAHTLAIAGGGTATCVVQHSADGVTWTDLVTFTPQTVAHKGQVITVLGTVNRHLRGKVTLSAGTVTVHIAAGRIPVL